MAAAQLDAIRQASNSYSGRNSGLEKLTQLLTHVHRDSLHVDEFLLTVACQLAGDQFATVLFGDHLQPKGDLPTRCIERISEFQSSAPDQALGGMESLMVMAMTAVRWARDLNCLDAETDLSVVDCGIVRAQRQR